LVFPGRSTNPRDLILIGLFTGIVGVSFLLAVQFLAYYAHGFWVSGGGAVTIILLILNFIEFSYRSALDPNTNILWSFLGFTFGVGLLEELCKAAPLIFYYRNCETMSWRGACRWGLASGVGFGVAEAISYAADFYNGIETEGIYVVRFVSCVGLHGIWSASAGITLYRCQHLIQGDLEWKDYIWPLIRVLGIAMVLHGLYDTLLKKDMFEMALAVAVVSFGWLAWQIESLREEEKKELAAAC
ncbi:MAG TPA: PrsW family glutamic-type intramembrane protease, partial [Gemmataceae bacterium]|nr:PrsW family glutamic-type intramembrane protease [Gemmataceae bacterium]